MFAFIPFGSIDAFRKSAEFGMFNPVAQPSFWFLFMNRALTYVYFAVLICGIIIPLAYKMKLPLKYKLEIIFGITSVVILLSGGKLLMLIFG